MVLQMILLDPRFGDEFPVPAYATLGSAAMDLRAMTLTPITLNPGDTFMIPTGIKMSMPITDMAAHLLPRSGLGCEGLVLGNLVGLIDSDYQGELKIPAWNRSDRPITFGPGDRVAQLCFLPILRPTIEFVSEFPTITIRGEGGFGHTGVN